MPLPSLMFIPSHASFLLQSFLGEIPKFSLTLYSMHLLLTPISKWEVDRSTWKSHRHFKLHFSPAPPSTPALSVQFSSVAQSAKQTLIWKWTRVSPDNAVLPSIFPSGLRCLSPCLQNILVTILSTKYYQYYN